MTSESQSAEWRPAASRGVIEARARLLGDIRTFFSERGVLEVETPVLSSAGNSDPNIENMVIEGEQPAFLRTSPEYAMKRLLAMGTGDIYELGRVFRAGERGRHHHVEFTMLEWYRIGMGYRDLADEVIALVRRCGRGAFDDWPVRRVSFRDLFQEHTGLDPFHCTESELAECAVERGILSPPLEHGQWIDLIVGQVIQPALPGEHFTVVEDFLPEQAALARIRKGDPDVAERFEVYLNQSELANGYQELTDAEEQLSRFERENRLRGIRGETTAPLDMRLIAALRHGMPECSGVALGVDRLLMAITRLDRITAVLSLGNDPL